MKHHFFHILENWYAHKDEGQWLLATIINTRGSAYRKAGAMMLFNDQGGQLGVVSGGCLESDLFHQARKCWMTGEARTVTYDMREEGDVAWRLGIGCGGEVTLLLQPVTAENHYLYLPQMLTQLKQHEPVTIYHQTGRGKARCEINPSVEHSDGFFHTISPPNTLMIMGGGVDALPLADMATRIGWRVFVNDERARYARPHDFAQASGCTELDAEALSNTVPYQQADAIIVMHHQVSLDAQAIRAISLQAPPRLKYLALLGPQHRTQRVLSEANVAVSELPLALQSPAGFDIGGDLPESIALSMLSQAHAAVHNKPYQINSLACQSFSA